MTAPRLDHRNIVAFIADIFERRGAESYLGEAVTMSEHMLQGAVLAEQEGAPEELVAAALLHDIGHYTSEFGTMSLGDERDNYHEESGAAVLGRLLGAGQRVAGRAAIDVLDVADRVFRHPADRHRHIDVAVRERPQGRGKFGRSGIIDEGFQQIVMTPKERLEVKPRLRA